MEREREELAKQQELIRQKKEELKKQEEALKVLHVSSIFPSNIIFAR
jgi:hypothetical protein